VVKSFGWFDTFWRMLTLSKFVDKVFCYRFADSNRYLQARFGVNDNRRAVATNALGDAPRLSQDARLIFSRILCIMCIDILLIINGLIISGWFGL
jgi:hypothetical protein